MQRGKLGRAGRPAYQRSLAERAHKQDAEAEVVGQRQDRALDLALGRVVRHLDGVDSPGGHELGQFAEGGRGVVSGSEQADQPPVPRGFQHRQVLGPGHQVVDLHEVDAAAVPVHRAGELRRALFRGGSPDLVGDDDLIPLAAESAGTSRTWTWAELDRETAALAAEIPAATGANGVVLIEVDNGMESVLGLLAALRTDRPVADDADIEWWSRVHRAPGRVQDLVNPIFLASSA